ncbi:hypothetical protein PGB90_005697 [Kerria lacca]
MRNLQILRNLSISDFIINNFNKFYVIPEQSSIKSIEILGFTKSLEIYLLIIDNTSSLKSIFISNLPQDIEVIENISVLECKYIFNDLFIILNTGHLLKVSLLNSECNELVPTILNTGPLKCCSWSSDYERTVCINIEDILSVFTIEDCNFEKLIDISLQEIFEEQNKFVNVGWGSVETQFRGSEGKYSTIVNQEIHEESFQDKNLNDDTVHICWKYNCTAFAVNYICKKDNIRKIKVFNQDGVLLNVTKSIYGLQSASDWCSLRNLITCVQTLPNKQVICFLEENALLHGDFQLPENIKITKLLWNNSGDILACIGSHLIHNQEFIALWTTSNYKWYMKQNLKFKERIVYVQWDAALPNRLHIILKSGVYRMIEWLFQINESSKCNCENNLSLVAVINNNNVNFTPYRLVYQPPSIPFKTNNTFVYSVNAVIFPNMTLTSEHDYFDCNSTILYLDNNQILLLKYENTNIADIFSFTFNDPNVEIDFSTPVEMSAWLWILPNSLFFNWSRQDGNYFCVSHLDIANKSIIITKLFKLDSLIITIVNRDDDVIIHSEDGKLFIFQDDRLHLMSICFIEPCHFLEVINSDTLIALNQNKNLYINETIKWRDVISFYWKNPFLILVTMENQLLISKLDFVDERIQFKEIFGRNIEPRSYLVTLVDDQVILETKRGNIETITPRPFIIFKMEEMIKNSQYFEVFQMLRKQRINMNVIFDHDPASFLNNIKNIVNSMQEPSYLLTFITELKDENVAEKMFPWKYSKIKNETENKVLTICKALSDSIKELNNEKLNSSLIAALVRQDKLAEAANYAIKYNEIATLCHLSDAVIVYEAALASYDLECALKIIQYSKLDPSEYLPFIRELQETEENYRKFKICNYLEKYDEALKYLSNYEENEKFEECLKYIHKHKLYVTALELYNIKQNSVSNGIHSQYIKILTIVAEYFYENKFYEEAAILFEKAKLNEKALVCYLAIGDWFSSISIIKTMNCEKSIEMKMFSNTYDLLYKQGKYEDAAFIAYNFIGNCEIAVQTYLTAKKYCRSINVATSFKNENILRNIIKPYLKEEVTYIIESINSNMKSLNTYSKRLHDLREKNKQQDNDDEDDHDRMSCISSTDSSDCSSVSSFGSRASSVSSTAKRARRRERKLWNLKPGNPREELSLLNILREIITNNSKQYSESIPDLTSALIKTDDLNLAKELNVEYAQFLKLIDNIRREVWPVTELKEEGGFKDIQTKCPPDICITGRKLHLFNS